MSSATLSSSGFAEQTTMLALHSHQAALGPNRLNRRAPALAYKLAAPRCGTASKPLHSRWARSAIKGDAERAEAGDQKDTPKKEGAQSDEDGEEEELELDSTIVLSAENTVNALLLGGIATLVGKWVLFHRFMRCCVHSCLHQVA